MDSRSVNTKSLIDCDHSSESIDSIDSLELALKDTTSDSDPHSPTSAYADNFDEKDSKTLVKEGQRNEQECETLSDVPSLIDASDFDDTHSQASIASSLWSTACDPQHSSQSGQAEQILRDLEEVENVDESEKKLQEEKVEMRGMILNVISEETTNSLNTVKTSNKDIQESNSNLEYDLSITEIRSEDDLDDIVQEIVQEVEEFSPSSNLGNKQLENHISHDQIQHPHKFEERQSIQKNMAPERRTFTMFENSINFIIDFFSCSTPNLKSEEHPGSEQNKSYAAGLIENQLENLQTCIEVDILNLMGCSTEGTQSLIAPCNKCYCPMDHDDDSCQDSFASDKDSSDNRPKLRNRNVYGRQKALKRIQQLRQSGLNRHFSLAPVANYLEEDLEEEANAARMGNFKSMRIKSFNEDGSKKGTLMPLSQRPKALGGDSRETSLGGSSTASYELMVMTTRSYDASGCDEVEQDPRKETQSDTGTLFGTDLFSRLFRNSPSKNTAHQESSQDLFYDSDPGTYDGNEMIDASELRLSFGARNNQRSRTIGIVDEMPLGQIRGNSVPSNKSLLQSLNVYSFDIHNSDAISHLIKEIITDSFLLIWHPKKKMSDWSAFSNAPPRRVKAWFEMGSCLKKKLLQPKFVWRSIDQTRFSSRQRRIQSILSIETVDLLNIVRIVAPTNIDRQMHPFVRKDCAFIIATNDEDEALFETATKDERDKFVFAFKLMVARLASKIIVGDKDVFEEFFTPLAIINNNRRRKKKRRKPRRKNFNAGVIYMDKLNEDAVTDTSSIESDNGTSFSRALVGSVREESNRKDELWGI